jgi:hypothetical protein
VLFEALIQPAMLAPDCGVRLPTVLVAWSGTYDVGPHSSVFRTPSLYESNGPWNPVKKMSAGSG